MDFTQINLDILGRIFEDITYGIIIGVLLTLVLLALKKVGRRNLIKDFS